MTLRKRRPNDAVNEPERSRERTAIRIGRNWFAGCYERIAVRSVFVFGRRLALDDLAPAVVAVLGDIVAQVNFAGSRISAELLGGEGVMRAAHAAAGRGFATLCDCHVDSPITILPVGATRRIANDRTDHAYREIFICFRAVNGFGLTGVSASSASPPQLCCTCSVPGFTGTTGTARINSSSMTSVRRKAPSVMRGSYPAGSPASSSSRVIKPRRELICTGRSNTSRVRWQVNGNAVVACTCRKAIPRSSLPNSRSNTTSPCVAARSVARRFSAARGNLPWKCRRDCTMRQASTISGRAWDMARAMVGAALHKVNENQGRGARGEGRKRRERCAHHGFLPLWP